MKKLAFLLLMLMIPTISSAELVNLTKPGTTWIWKVENGINQSGGFALVEDGSNIVSESEARVRLEENEYWYLFLETGGRVLSENDEIVLLDSFSAKNYSALYLQLTGQGWVKTESAATVPQGLDGTSYASSFRFALNEDSTFLVMENTNNLRLEN